MLIRVSTILSISLLVLLQYGKITSYLYCEWQAKVVLQLPDCNCSQMIDGVFDNDDHSSTGITSSKEKYPDFTPVHFVSQTQLPQLIFTSFGRVPPAGLITGHTARINRPPIA